MRRELDLNGNGCTDCLASFCCPCCQLIQEDREAQDWQEGKGVYAAMQPTKHDPMTYSAQVCFFYSRQ